MEALARPVPGVSLALPVPDGAWSMCRSLYQHYRTFVAGRLRVAVALTLAGCLAACSPDGERSTSQGTRQPQEQPPAADPPEQAMLRTACSQLADYWRRQLGTEGRALVCPPFILAGNLTERELQTWHDRTIRPAAHVMRATYFDREPDRPITILMFADEATYRAEAERLFGDRAVSRHGYYRPHLNTIVVNGASGASALLHELTHALMLPDFPEAPAWLWEGLAALHEDCRIESEPPRLTPLPGARLRTLQRAMAEGRLPSVAWLLQTPRFEGPERAAHYALARHFCRFLDDRGVLQPVYREFRGRRGSRLDHAAAVHRQLGIRSSAELERAFREWASG